MPTSNAKDINAANLGTKYVTETGATGWDLTGIVCSGTASYSIGTGTGSGFQNNFLFTYYADHHTLHSFPTRRSSDLCTYTNTKHASLTINKTAVGGDDSFGYST